MSNIEYRYTFLDDPPKLLGVERTPIEVNGTSYVYVASLSGPVTRLSTQEVRAISRKLRAADLRKMKYIYTKLSDNENRSSTMSEAD